MRSWDLTNLTSGCTSRLATEVSFAGVGGELARSSLGLGHSSSFPVEEACASSGMRFRAPESLKGSFVGVGSELARSRSSVEGVKSGCGDLLRGKDKGRGAVAFWGGSMAVRIEVETEVWDNIS